MLSCRLHIQLLLLIILGNVLDVSGQKEKAYESISIAQGLSQGMIFDLIQDREGFIWVATKNGLNRYDGYGFKIFTNDPYNDQSLSSNTILRLFEDSQGRIWVGTENAGVNVYDKKTGIFHRITHDPKNAESLSGNGIRSFEEMPDGSIMVATDLAGLNLVTLPANFFTQGAKVRVERITLPRQTQVYGMGKDQQGVVWIGGMDGFVYQFKNDKNRFTLWPTARLYNSGYFTKDGAVLVNHNLYVDDGKAIKPLFNPKLIREGNILLRPNEALWELHHREFHFYDYTRWGPEIPINWNEKLPFDTSTRICYPFILDKSGIVWSGSVGYGLRKYHATNAAFTTWVKGKSVRRIIPNADNQIFWVDYGYRWQCIDQDGISKPAFPDMPKVAEIDNILISSQHEFWIKSDKTGYYTFKPETRQLTPYPKINANQSFGRKQPFLEDRKGNIWLPGFDGSITVYNANHKKIDSILIKNTSDPVLCTALFEDMHGIIWVGTENGMAKLIIPDANISQAKVQWYRNQSNNRNSLSYNAVSHFLEDPQDPETYLWIGTKGGGLNRLNKKTNDFFHITAKDGLPDDVVYGILPDDKRRIWGSTNNGIFCMTASNVNQKIAYYFRNFTKSAGLQDDEFNTGAFAKLPNGNLAFGGINGINVFDPETILQNDFKPSVYITNILSGNEMVLPNDKTGILNQTIEHASSITLNHLQDILTLEFSALDFTAPEQNKYRYQLVGIDKDWIESGTRRTATYLHLPAGSYVFKLQGSNSQGMWTNKIVELNLKVLPPWWRTWWAYALYALAIGLLLRFYFRFKLSKNRLQTQLIMEQQEAKRMKDLDAVKTQLYSNITHEFRTPLTVILGMANQIKNNSDKHLDTGLDMIVRNGENLLNLINQMLDLSKLDDGKLTLQETQEDIIRFIRYIVESFQSLAAGQQKQFHFLSDTDELVVHFDAEKIRQIITNLFYNALKFTPPGGNIYVTVSQQLQQNVTETKLILKVKDTGIGIPEAELFRIFDRFYQLDSSHTRHAEGTGIGLALTKELVKLMRGSIDVSSPPVGATKGTEFTIQIPLRIASKDDVIQKNDVAPILARSSASDQHQTSLHQDMETLRTDTKPLILLVEDNADVVAYTATCLSDYRLAVGKDGNEGFEIATTIIPDLIITDVMMPFTDGFAMCRQLREDERTSHIPIIMLTAKADLPSKLEGLETGADAYIEKPFHQEELLLRIRKLLELRKSLQEYYSRQIGLTVEPILSTNTLTQPVLEEKAEHAFVQKIRQLIEAHFTSDTFNVEQLCKLAFMSHSQLHRKLEALTGHSPNRFIRIIRIKKAQELLANPALSIADVSLDCGYNDPGYFARVFKQELGVTPQEWRQGKGAGKL